MGTAVQTPAKAIRQTIRLALLPTLLAAPLALIWPAAASAQSCDLHLLNTVPLNVIDNAAWVPGTVGTKGGDTKQAQFQFDTAAPDNQMGRDAMESFGLSAVDYTPRQDPEQQAGFGISQANATFIDGTQQGLTFADPTTGAMGSDAPAIYDAHGHMFHSMTEARPFILGAMRTDALQFVVTTLPLPGSGGILSADFFKKYDIDLDFSYHKLNMFSSDHCPGQVVYWRAPGVARLPFKFRNGQMVVKVNVDGRDVDAVINTGSPRSEILIDDYDSFFYRGPNSAGTVLLDDGNYAYNFGVLSFGNVAIYHPYLVLTHSVMVRGMNTGPRTGTLLRDVNQNNGLQPTLMIGTDLLKKLHIYIAFKEKMIYITQGPELAQGDPHTMAPVAVTPQRP